MRNSVTVPESLLPALARARAVIRERSAFAGTTAGDCRAEVDSVEIRAHSVITTIRATNGSASHRYYLKTLRATEANLALKRLQTAQEHQLLEDLSRRFRPYEGLGVITPIGCWPDELSILTEEFPGEKVSRFFRRARGFPSDEAAEQVAGVCRRVGRWLALFQAFTEPSDSTSFDVRDLLAYCDRRIRLLADARTREFARSLAGALATRLDHLAAQVDPADLRPVGRHNDFRPDNIVTDGKRIAVLDFTGFTAGPPMYDFMKFWMKLEDLRFGLSFRPGVVDAWERAFADGYGATVSLRSPICVLLRAANVLDKLSEAILPNPAPGSVPARVVAWARYRYHIRWLHRFAQGAKSR